MNCAGRLAGCMFVAFAGCGRVGLDPPNSAAVVDAAPMVDAASAISPDASSNASSAISPDARDDAPSTMAPGAHIDFGWDGIALTWLPSPPVGR